MITDDEKKQVRALCDREKLCDVLEVIAQHCDSISAEHRRDADSGVPGASGLSFKWRDAADRIQRVADEIDV